MADSVAVPDALRASARLFIKLDQQREAAMRNFVDELKRAAQSSRIGHTAAAHLAKALIVAAEL